MRIKLLFLTVIGMVSSASAQLSIVNTETPAELIQNTFAGNNVTISNIKFNLSTSNSTVVTPQFARFFNGTAGIAMEDGLIIATGNASVALAPNTQGGATSPIANSNIGDIDLHLAINSPVPIQSVGVVEFDFIPDGNTVLFEFVFASEEYPEFVNSTFNDVFGLFLSGPATNGPFLYNGVNIATVPNTSMAVSINNLNNGQQNAGPCINCQYYVSNEANSGSPLNSEIQYDGLTTVLTASGPVVPGELHHIRIAVGNVGDNGYDSAIFLKSGSFRAATLLSTVDASVNPVRMYPNPAGQFVRIDATTNISSATISDMTGRILKSVTVDSSNSEIDLSGMPKGTYLITFDLSGGGRDSQKLIIR